MKLHLILLFLGLSVIASAAPQTGNPHLDVMLRDPNFEELAYINSRSSLTVNNLKNYQLALNRFQLVAANTKDLAIVVLNDGANKCVARLLLGNFSSQDLQNIAQSGIPQYFLSNRCVLISIAMDGRHFEGQSLQQLADAAKNNISVHQFAKSTAPTTTPATPAPVTSNPATPAPVTSTPATPAPTPVAPTPPPRRLIK
jgi:hypothetical protein